MLAVGTRFKKGNGCQLQTIQSTLADDMKIADKTQIQTRTRALAIATICLFFAVALASFAFTRTHSPIQTAAQNGAPVTKHATGPFDVKLAPQGEDDKTEGSTLARYSLDKQYHGDLDGIAKGTMLTAGTDVKGSAGDVAMGRGTGTLQGRGGSFALQHSGTMAHGEQQQSIMVVPDSGTGQLVGIAGRLTVIIAGGKHSYEFEYSLPA